MAHYIYKLNSTLPLQATKPYSRLTARKRHINTRPKHLTTLALPHNTVSTPQHSHCTVIRSILLQTVFSTQGYSNHAPSHLRVFFKLIDHCPPACTILIIGFSYFPQSLVCERPLSSGSQSGLSSTLMQDTCVLCPQLMQHKCVLCFQM